jgi:hypothetical protein
MHSFPKVALLAVLALAASSGTALAGPVEESASLGETRAAFSYDKDEYEYTGMWLTVSRAGEVVHDEPVRVSECEEPLCMPGGFEDRRSLSVADLDGGGEPEVLLDVFTGGAHCCVATQVLRWDGTGYRTAERNWRDPGYEVEDISGDGVPELRSADARFAYRFASFAGSAMPVAIWRFQDGTFVDVTEAFPAVVERDADRWLRVWRGRRGKRDRESLGVLAAWAANEYRLGHRAEVRRQLRTALRRGWLRGSEHWPRGRAYIRELDRFLTRAGYRS